MIGINKKKILVFIPEFPGLTETFIEREVSKLAKSPSLQVEVLSIKKGNGDLSDNLLSRVHYTRLEWRHSFIALKYFFIYPKRIFQSFFIAVANKNRNIVNNIYLFLKSLGYAVIFEKYKPDLIYSHFMSESSTVGLLVSIVLNTEFAVAAHAKDVLQEDGPIDENVELISQKVKYSKFISVCNKNAYQKLIKKANIKYPKNIYLKYHGIDEKWLKNKLKESKELEIPKKFITFSIGRFVEKKGFVYLVEAANI